jgi:hypothetical protein
MQGWNTEASAESERLLRAARALEAVADSANVATVPDVLEDLEAALRAAGSALEGIAAAVVPPDGAISDRYRRAAARWPTAPAPSYEQFARLLGALHDTASELRVAAGRCRRARAAARPLTKARGLPSRRRVSTLATPAA